MKKKWVDKSLEEMDQWSERVAQVLFVVVVVGGILWIALGIWLAVR